MAVKDDITRNTPVDNTVEGASDSACVADAGHGGDFDSKGVAQAVALEDIRTQMLKQVDELQLVNGAVSVCVEALLRQNADLDADIASVLQRIVGNKLFETAECLELMALAVEYSADPAENRGATRIQKGRRAA